MRFLSFRTFLKGFNHQPHPSMLLRAGFVTRRNSFYFDLPGCRYLPTIRFSFFFVAAGIFFRSLRMAFARAEPHLQERSRGMSETVCRTTLQAFSAFFTKTAMT